MTKEENTIKETAGIWTSWSLFADIGPRQHRSLSSPKQDPCLNLWITKPFPDFRRGPYSFQNLYPMLGFLLPWSLIKFDLSNWDTVKMSLHWEKIIKKNLFGTNMLRKCKPGTGLTCLKEQIFKELWEMDSLYVNTVHKKHLSLIEGMLKVLPNHK